jgi:hypothetical protein
MISRKYYPRVLEEELNKIDGKKSDLFKESMEEYNIIFNVVVCRNNGFV